MEIHEILKALTAPWSKDEIKWRVGSMNKEKTKALPLAYVDARVVMERLDNVIGALNWQDRYEFAGTRTMCYLSLRIGGEWLCKSDGAGDSDIEGEKGGISDAFKRAAVKWGMGRELYELKCKWMPIDKYKQLDGDPWDFVIGNKTKDKKKDKPKAEEKPEETPQSIGMRLVDKIKSHTCSVALSEWERKPAVVKAIKDLNETNPVIAAGVESAIKAQFVALVKI